jgi:glutathione S-transferase
MLINHGAAQSRAFRCLWAAEEAGIAYAHKPVPVGPCLRQAGRLAPNPNGKVPTAR